MALKVAIVYDWLTNMGGGERVVLAAHKAFPDAPIYTSAYVAKNMPAFADCDIRTTWLQKLPAFLRRKHQLFPVFRAYAFRNMHINGFDVVLSISSAEAKAVHTTGVHINYCFTPTRYYWSHYEEYKQNPGFGPLNPIIRLIIPPFVRWMRKLDLQAADGVDYFIGNSSVVAQRIKKYYKRRADILFPSVEVDRWKGANITSKHSGFVIVGRQVAYKRIDLAIQVCNELKIPLTIYGQGPEHDALVRMAGPTITFVVGGTDAEINHALTAAEGFLYPQEEDFGITQVEAMAAGCPVIAYARGGALDVVVDGKTGVLFDQQTPKSLLSAIERFKTIRFDPKTVQAHAKQFSEERFIRELQEYVATHAIKPKRVEK